MSEHRAGGRVSGTATCSPCLEVTSGVVDGKL